MRFPIYPAHYNPDVDKPILRKKIAYILELINERRAEWIDEDDRSKGVVLCDTLPDKYDESLERAAGADFNQAWHVKQSGPEGPIVWQLRPQPTP